MYSRNTLFKHHESTSHFKPLDCKRLASSKGEDRVRVIGHDFGPIELYFEAGRFQVWRKKGSQYRNARAAAYSPMELVLVETAPNHNANEFSATILYSLKPGHYYGKATHSFMDMAEDLSKLTS